MQECQVCHTPLEIRGTKSFCPACMLRDLWSDDEEPVTEPLELTTPPPQDSSMPVVPRHRMIDRVGEGGFAIVYRAMQTEPVRREVAVKVLRANIATAHVLARFDVERQTLARMDHPGIARLWDAGQADDGQPYFAMELVRGHPVTTYCKEHQLPLRERLGIFIAICQAVQHAHEKGVLHRDLKPSNLLVTHDRQVKVIDFGIAKALEVMPDDESPRYTTSLHQAVGTPGYMSPEQSEWGAHHVDARSDIYALGVVLYELLTGKTPLEVERTSDDTARRRPVALHVTPPSRLRNSLLISKTERRDLDAIVLKALETDSQHRYPSAAALADDVERHLHDKPVDAGQASWTYVMEKFTRRHRGLVAMSAITLTAIVAGFGLSTVLYFKEQHARSIADERREQVEERERELQRALSRADFRAAQNYKREADYQSAAAALVRSLQSDPGFAVAGADLQTLLAYSELPSPLAAPLPLHPAWGEVKRGAVSADGRAIAAVLQPKNGEKRLFLWEYHDSDWDTRELGIPRGIAQLSLSGRGKFVCFADGESTVTLVNLEQEPNEFRKWKAPAKVSHIMVETRLPRAIIGCDDGKVWSVTSNEKMAPVLLFDTRSRIERLAAGLSQRWIIAGCHDGSVWRWHPAQGSTQGTLLFKLPAAITALTQANNGTRVAAGDVQGNALLVTAAMPTGTPRRLHNERITAIGIGDDNEVVTAGRELTVRWTDMSTGNAVAPLLDSAGQIEQVVVNHNGQEIMLVAADTSVRLWHKDGVPPLTIRKPQHARYIAMSVAGRGLVVTRDEGRAMEVIGLTTRSASPMLLHPGKAITVGDARPRCFAFARDSSLLLASDGRATASLWDTATARLHGSSTWTRTALATASTTGGNFVTALGDGSLIDVPPNEKEPAVLLGPDEDDSLSPLAEFKHWQTATVSADGQAAAWSEEPVNTLANCHIRVFERATGQIRRLQHPRVMCLAISASARLLVLGLNNGVVRFVNLATNVNDDYSWHLSRISSLALSSDGSTLITGSTDGNVGIWDTRTRQPRSDYVRLGSPVLGVALSADARRFAATTSRDAQVGDVSVQAILGPRLAVPHCGGEVALNADGTRLAVAGVDGATTIFQIAPDVATLPLWFADLALVVSSRKFTPDGVLEATSHPGLPPLLSAMPASATGTWAEFARWLLSHPGARGMTPWTSFTLEDYLESLATRPGDASDLERNRHAPSVRSLQAESRPGGSTTPQ